MRQLRYDNQGSVIPLILFLLTLIIAGALYSLFFIEIGYPILALIPIASTVYKTFIMMCFYGIPMFVLFVGIISLFLSALKNEQGFFYSG